MNCARPTRFTGLENAGEVENDEKRDRHAEKPKHDIFHFQLLC
jgi:hypothetical protein